VNLECHRRALRRLLSCLLLALGFAAASGCAAARALGAASAADVAEASVRAHMEFLASDALNGRGSGTRDEWIAVTYAAAQMRRLGLEPLGDAGSHVQEVPTAGGGRTWNAVGRLPGRDPSARSEVILLSAHIDHLGNRAAAGGKPAAPAAAAPAGAAADTIYNGADDAAAPARATSSIAPSSRCRRSSPTCSSR
jgi:hypothetical protein